MKLWEINEALENVFRIEETGEAVDVETGEIFDEDYLNNLEMAFDEKLKNILLWIKDMKYGNDAIDSEMRRLKALKKRNTNRIGSLMLYVASVMNGKKWEAGDKSCAISYRMSRDVVTIDSLADIPDEYFKIPHNEQNLNKTKIKESIKAGNDVAGVHLQDNNNLQVK